MDMQTLRFAAVPLLAAIAFTTVQPASAADAPTAAQALGLTPIQSLVEYTVPSKEEAAQCVVRPEKENGVTSWVVRNKQGEILRRFADSNSDNVVDEWCYFLGGLEVYRDIDSNFNGKADEYRWFNTAGTRWGLDKNEDGKVDSWKMISPHEVAEQVVFALKTRDQARFELLLLPANDLNDLGFGKTRSESISQSLKNAPAAFSKVVAEQKIVSPQTRYVDFGSARPATIPSGSDGSTKDVVICDNGTALIQTDDKHEQVFLGTLVSVGNTWKLIDAPAVGSENQRQDGGFFALSQQSSGGASGDNSPSDDMQKQMQILDELDKQADSASPEEYATNVEQRVAALQQLAKTAPDSDRDQWTRQMIDVIGVAIQTGNFPKGDELLGQLQKSLEEAKANDELVAHAAFQRMWALYAVSQRDPAADAEKLQQIQEKWLTDLQAFVTAHPKSADAAEALFQLGMYQEYMGKPAEASKLYQQLVSTFPQANPSKKAAGALNRLNLLNKAMTLRGADAQGGTVDLAAYRGKAVLIHYWSTVNEHWKDDMVVLRDFYAKKGGRDFDIIGVCLDDDPAAAKQFVAQNKLPWKQIYDPGLDGRLANEMGVITLPLLILVDQKGIVANQNVNQAQLDSELAKIAKPAAPAAQVRPAPAGQVRPANQPGPANALRAQPANR